MTASSTLVAAERVETTALKRFNPDCLPNYPRMSWAVSAAGLLFLSGIVAIDAKGEVIGAGNAEMQAAACLDIIAAILAEANTPVENIVKLTCFATCPEAARAYVDARPKRFAGRPAATTVIVGALLNPAIMLEIELIALAAQGNAP